MDTLNFYKDLQAIDDFSKITDEKLYKKLPSSWYVIVSDVKNSTKAIEKGKYKEVNLVSSLIIIGILNINKNLDLPFIFSGDGATILIPPILIEDSKEVLLEAQKIAKEQFSLSLRVGIISVKDIEKENKKIYIAKYSKNKNHTQAFITGNGVLLAEKMLKKDLINLKKEIYIKREVDFSGLECRWRDIPAAKEEVISLLIKTNNNNLNSYKQILLEIEKIVGSTKQRDPIQYIKNLNLSFDPRRLDTEATIFSTNYISKIFKLLKISFENFLGLLLMKNKIGEWANYKNRILDTTDSEKFDDMLKMVISTNKEQTKKLQNYLNKEVKENKLKYGIHISTSTIMTCLVFERHGKHIHFIDGSNGGYALAAKQMKSL